MALRKRMSTEEHEAVARRLLAVISEMEEVGKVILHPYGASSRLGKRDERFFTTGARSQWQEFRSRLDDAWYREWHERNGVRNPYYANVPGRSSVR
jgi:hypothetical protein